MLSWFTPTLCFIICLINAALFAAAIPFALRLYFKARRLGPLNQTKENLKREIKDLSAVMDSLRAEVGAAREKIGQAADLKKWMEDKKAEVTNLNTEATRAREDWTKARDELNQKEEEVGKKRIELADLNAKRDRANTEIEDFRQEKKILDRILPTLRTESADLKLTVERKKEEVQKLNAEINELAGKRDRLNREIAQLEVQKATLNKTIDTLKPQAVKLEAAQQAMTTLEATEERRKQQEKDLWQTLTLPVPVVPRDYHHQAQKTALDGFYKALCDCGYVFTERTIYAFHTSLLCGDISPLLVLSGVSGTGKSMLPELYAKYFGMNFLSIAVQPRWDGPQDIFGFYNHMEVKFNATDLSRHLWAFDQYNNPNTEHKNRMCLILLDEMNLARVEFYFSELLSKLENRNRLTDPTNEEDRKVAEVEFECGSSRETRRVLVWKNILFVGTMNEDESTQTLSSKVIDRSNVLRFGVPENTNAEPNKEAFQKLCKQDVTFDTWNKWTASKELPVEVNKHINSLKDLLSKVGRGFGYRTGQSVETYIRRYPSNHWKHALADQIEMKILPKLNGVECHQIQELISTDLCDIFDKIEANEIKDSFQKILNDPEASFFSWEGVKR